MASFRSLVLVSIMALVIGCSGTDDSASDTKQTADNAADTTPLPDVTDDISADMATPDVAPDLPRQDLVADSNPEEVADPDVEVPEDVPAKPDVFDTGVSPKGFNKPCVSGADCAEFGLSCFRYGTQDVDPICSKLCDDNMDCPVYYVCDYKFGYETPVKICKPARFCSECQDDVQCDYAGMKCISYKKEGERFCSEPCVPGVPSCPGGAVCDYVESSADWRCVPTYGSCKGDGGVCSPCNLEEDCQSPSFHCIESYYTKERFCSKECDGPAECPTGHSCFDVGAAKGLCFLTHKGEYVPTCHAGTQGFCRECRGNYECAEGHICYVGPGGTGFYCTTECKASADCGENTECKGSFSLSTGLLDGFGCAIKEGVTCQQLIEQSMGLQ